MIRRRKLKKQNKALKRQNSELAASQSVPKITQANAPRVEATKDNAIEVSHEKLRDLGKQLGAVSPEQFEAMVKEAFRDKRITSDELEELLTAVAILFAVGQEHTKSEAAYLAAKAKESRIVGEEVGDELLAAGLVSSDDFMTDFGRGAIFLGPEGRKRRLDVGSLMAALALQKSSVLIPKLPGTTALQDRLFSARPESVLRHVGDDEVCIAVRAYEYTDGEDDVEVTGVALTELYDPAKHTHITGLVMKSTTTPPTVDRAIFGFPSTVPANAVATVNQNGAGYCYKTFEIAKLWPSLKAGERIPLSWHDADADLPKGVFGHLIEEKTGFVAPLLSLGAANSVQLFHAARVTNALDMAAVGSLAAMIGITHLTDKPWMQALGLVQGSLESLINRAGTVDYSTSARDVV